MTNRFIDLNKARTDEQRKVMQDIEQAAECPFCQENLAKYHKKAIIKSGEYWQLTENQWPYEYTDPHLIAISVKHVEMLSDLSQESFAELLILLQWAEQEYKVKAGGVAMRFGDVTKTGASVSHLHAHFIIPAVSKPEGHKIRFKIAN